MNAVHSYHSAIYDTPKSPKLKPSFWFAVIVAAVLHLAGGIYLVQQKFAIHAPVIDDGGTIVIDYPPKDKPKPKPQPIKTNPPPKPPPTTFAPRPSPQPIPDDVDTAPLTPTDQAPVGDGKTPPVIAPEPTAGQGTEPAEPAYVQAKWTRFPDAQALADYYPDRATSDEVEGEATLECTVVDAAGKVACSVLDEQPKGYGFGKATMRMVQDKGRVDTSQGNVRIGSRLRTKVKWTLE